MSTTTKSPRKVFLRAIEVGKRTLSDYSHECSPRKYTQPQLFACLVLKSFLRVDYRGVVAFLQDCPSLREAIGMEAVPHYTTLHKACRRLMQLPRLEQMLVASLRMHSPRRGALKGSGGGALKGSGAIVFGTLSAAAVILDCGAFWINSSNGCLYDGGWRRAVSQDSAQRELRQATQRAASRIRLCVWAVG